MMISKVKNAMSTLVGGMMPHGHHHNHHSGGGQTCGPDSLPPRFPYGRPDFLDLTPELLQYSTEHASRPVLTLKRGSRLSWQTGYAEWVGLKRHSLTNCLKRTVITKYCVFISSLRSVRPVRSVFWAAAASADVIVAYTAATKWCPVWPFFMLLLL